MAELILRPGVSPGECSKILAVMLLCLGLSLGGCTSRPAWQVYDACAAQTSGFVAMVQCGKAKRNAACQEAHDCSDVGNAFVQYADALVAQVESHQITEADAMARFAEYKTKTIQDAQRNNAAAMANMGTAMQNAGAALSSINPPPMQTTNCQMIGNIMQCHSF